MKGLDLKEGNAIGVCVGLIAGGLVLAGISGAGLSWDGSYMLFRILDSQAPFVAHNRWIVIPFHWLVLLSRRLTSNVTVLGILFGLVYVFIPILALAASWWVVRKSERSMFVWPVLGIGLGTLPGQFMLTTESTMAVQLFWPLLLAILTGIRNLQGLLVVFLAFLILITHPIAVLLLAIGAVFAFGIGVARSELRRKMWLWAMGLGATSAARLAIFWKTKTGFEASQISFHAFQLQFRDSVAGLPLLSLTLASVAATLIFISPLVNRPPIRKLATTIRAVELTCLVAAGVLLILWARDPRLWWKALDFRGFAPLSSLVFMMFAALESVLYGSHLPSNTPSDWNLRLASMQVVGLTFLLVISVQSTAWFGLTERLRKTIAQSPTGCISTTSIEWLAGTPLNHWATPALSILLQGRSPQMLVLDGNACAEAGFPDKIRIAPWYVRTGKGGWFALQATQPSCVFALTSGWHLKEQRGTDWFRWTDGQGQIRAFMKDAATPVMRGHICSMQVPNRVDVLVNGERQAKLDVRGDYCQAMSPVSLRLNAGEQTISFVSHNAAIVRGIDTRSFAFGLGNLTMIVGGSSCVLRP